MKRKKLSLMVLILGLMLAFRRPSRACPNEA